LPTAPWAGQRQGKYKAGLGLGAFGGLKVVEVLGPLVGQECGDGYILIQGDDGLGVAPVDLVFRTPHGHHLPKRLPTILWIHQLPVTSKPVPAIRRPRILVEVRVTERSYGPSPNIVEDVVVAIPDPLRVEPRRRARPLVALGPRTLEAESLSPILRPHNNRRCRHRAAPVQGQLVQVVSPLASQVVMRQVEGYSE
jgi:hypothetical protein